jgi:beta-glucosidase-like glycosyl hydrolase
MKGAVEDGTIPMRRVKESLLRIEETREKLSRQDYPYCRADFSRALFRPDDSLQKALAEKSVVILETAGIYPLRKTPR